MRLGISPKLFVTFLLYEKRKRSRRPCFDRSSYRCSIILGNDGLYKIDLVHRRAEVWTLSGESAWRGKEEMKRLREDMTEGLFKRIVEKVAREKPDCAIWPTFYGKALLLGDTLWRWLDYAASIGCHNIVLNSNGILLERYIDQVLASPDANELRKDE